TGSPDVGDDQVQTLGRAGCGGGDLRAELDRAPRTRRRELHDAEAVVEREVGVEPPPESRVEVLRAVGIRHRNHDHLELQVDVPGPLCPACLTAAFFCRAHTRLPQLPLADATRSARSRPETPW